MNERTKTSADKRLVRQRTRHIAVVVLRCLAVTLMLGGSFAGLAYLSALQRVATRTLQSEPGIYGYSLSVGLACLAPFCLTVVIAELQLALLLAGRWQWDVCARLLPWSFAILGGLFALMIFAPSEHGPKETMLVIGGALAAFLGSLVHLSLRWDSTFPHSAMQWPFDWTVALVLMGAGFLGAMKGWTGPSPQLRGVLTHQSRYWLDQHGKSAKPLAPVAEPPCY